MYKFIKSSTNKSNWYDHNEFEVAFWGRSNVGKSSLLNAITNDNKLAKVSKSPGRTRLLNFFENQDKIVLVDLPGYGYAKMSKTENENMLKTIDEYLTKRKNLKHLFLLIDSRHGITKIDEQILGYLDINNIEYSLVYTKTDKLNQKEKNQLIKRTKIEQQTFNNFEYLFVSSEKKSGISELNAKIYKLLEK